MSPPETTSKHLPLHSDAHLLAAFYRLAFLKRPARLIELPRNVATGRHESRLDRVVSDFFRRVGDSLRAAA